MDLTRRAPHPLRVEGERDASLSRWLWLVKWLLLMPHLVVLVFLWIAFAVLTVVAWFAILITARYPRAIFNFNLGRAALVVAGGVLRLQRARAPTATRRSPSPTSRTTRPGSTSPTRSSSPAGWRWSSGGCWRCRTTWCSGSSSAAPAPWPGATATPAPWTSAAAWSGCSCSSPGSRCCSPRVTRTASSTACSGWTAGRCGWSPTRR